MKENTAKVKALQFSVRIVKMTRILRARNKEYVIADQILRSATSIGANIAEAEYASSDRDMLHKLQISLKEAGETAYWLELLYKTDCFSDKEYLSLNEDCKELIKLLAASTSTLTKKLQEE